MFFLVLLFFWANDTLIMTERETCSFTTVMLYIVKKHFDRVPQRNFYQMLSKCYWPEPCVTLLCLHYFVTFLNLGRLICSVSRYIRGHFKRSKCTFPAVPNTCWNKYWTMTTKLRNMNRVYWESFYPSLTTKRGTLFPSVISLLTRTHFRTKWKTSKRLLRRLLLLLNWS